MICKTLAAVALSTSIIGYHPPMVMPESFPRWAPSFTNIMADPSVQEKENSNKPILESLGTYKLSAYCPCKKCCGKTDGITASGTQAKAGRTIAMNGIPFGTHIMIEGHEYIVEDRGGGLGKNIVDIFFDTHAEALNSGLWRDAEIFMIKE